MSKIEEAKKLETIGDACECLLDGIQSNNTHSRYLQRDVLEIRLSNYGFMVSPVSSDTFGLRKANGKNRH